MMEMRREFITPGHPGKRAAGSVKRLTTQRTNNIF